MPNLFFPNITVNQIKDCRSKHQWAKKYVQKIKIKDYFQKKLILFLDDYIIFILENFCNKIKNIF